MSEITFLSKAELYQLTHSWIPAKQRKWLTEHGYTFDVRLDGSNVVLSAHIHKKLGGNDSNLKIRTTGPDFGALEALQHA